MLVDLQRFLSGDVEKEIGLVISLLAVFKLLLLPLYDASVFQVLERNTINKNRLKNAVDQLYHDRFRRIDKAMDRVSHIEERLEITNRDLQVLSEYTAKQLAETMNRMTQAVKDQTAVLDEMRKEQVRQGNKLSGVIATINTILGDNNLSSGD